jgi:hypothetical protein
MRIGVVGRIKSGVEQGRYVLVEDDSESSGGYLILTGANRMLTLEGADSWVATLAELERYAEEAHWLIDWDNDVDHEEARGH